MGLRNRFVATLLVALWLVATQHCALEASGLFADDGVHASGGCCASQEAGCHTDGCKSVEDGQYRPDAKIVKVAAPELLACACLICLRSFVPPEPPDGNVLRRDFERSDAGAPIWHFVQRAALPARAPSLSLA